MNHIFLDVHMSISHQRMKAALADSKLTLSKGDTAIFINKSWTAAKIMTARRAYIYVREDLPFNVDQLITFPRFVGAKSLNLTNENYKLLAARRAKVKPVKLPKAA